VLRDDDLFFVPASTTAEAASRLFSLTGAPDPGTRGPKRALEALAVSVGVDIDLTATNAVLGGQIAAELGATWRAGRDFVDLQITLDGINRLLLGATSRLRDLSRRTSVESSAYEEVLRTFPAFQPARSKQEAVNRLSDLAHVPRDLLGPGGKEHRLTFEALASRMAPDLLDPSRPATKHAMVRALCERLDVPWLTSAASTGQSVTLEGLNLLLAGAERRVGQPSSGWGTAAEEGAALVRAIHAGLPDYWDGRQTVEAMREEESRSWRQAEWPGFFFEEQVRTILNRAYPTPPVGGPRRSYGATAFDYASAARVWDAKAHTILKRHEPSGRHQGTASSAAILNDSEAITACLTEQGLGFLVVDGAATFDDTGLFDEWHRAYTREGLPAADVGANSGWRRRRKQAFTPLVVRALWIDGLDELNAGLAGGWIRREKQGAQPVRPGEERGAARRDKFHLRVHRATPWVVSARTWDVADR
jgi:hypothetical protein